MFEQIKNEYVTAKVAAKIGAIKRRLVSDPYYFGELESDTEKALEAVGVNIRNLVAYSEVLLRNRHPLGFPIGLPDVVIRIFIGYRDVPGKALGVLDSEKMGSKDIVIENAFPYECNGKLSLIQGSAAVAFIENLSDKERERLVNSVRNGRRFYPR